LHAVIAEKPLVFQLISAYTLPCNFKFTWSVYELSFSLFQKEGGNYISEFDRAMAKYLKDGGKEKD
jgi:hypothetical protein